MPQSFLQTVTRQSRLRGVSLFSTACLGKTVSARHDMILADAAGPWSARVAESHGWLYVYALWLNIDALGSYDHACMTMADFQTQYALSSL